MSTSRAGECHIVIKGEAMSDTTRRKFLAAAGVGAAGVAVVGVTGVGAGSGTAAGQPIQAPSGAKLPAGASGALVAYVNDVQAGQISVMVGEQEVVISDHDLVARLAIAAAAGSKSTQTGV
jgi:hypothetical protein